MINEKLRSEIDKRFVALKDARQFIEQDYSDINLFVAPDRAKVTGDTQPTSRKDKLKALIDKECNLASNIMSAGMLAGNASPARPWFKLGFEDEELSDFAPVKKWLHDVEIMMLNIFSRSNAYRSMAGGFRDLGDFMTASTLVLRDPKDVIRLYRMVPGRYWIAEDDRHVVDTVYQVRRLTLKQIVKIFGADNLPDKLKDDYKRGNVFHSHEVLRAIEPREEFNPDSPLSKDMPFRSVSYVLGSDSRHILGESGFTGFPCLVPRWLMQDGDVYGTEGPGINALSSVKQLQLEVKEKHKGISKQVTPPLVAPAELQKAHGSTLGGGITYSDSPNFDKIKPLYEARIDLNALRDDIQEMKREINRIYHVDLFRMLSLSDDPRKTAREVQEQHEEKLLMLGPVLESVQDGKLGPLIDRTFDIIVESGILPEPPEDIEGTDLKVEYIGVLAQAQKAISLSGVDRFTGYVSNLAQLKPDALDKFDADKAVDEYADMLGVRPDLVISDDDVAEIRQQRAEAQQQQAQLDQALQASEAVAKVSSQAGEDLEDVYS